MKWRYYFWVDYSKRVNLDVGLLLLKYDYNKILAEHSFVVNAIHALKIVRNRGHDCGRLADFSPLKGEVKWL